MTRIGLLGGSFNPAHKGHRAVSLQAMRALGLDEVWWLVSPGNPLKDGARDMAPFAARLSSATRMARGSRIRATAIETKLGTRYTVDTLKKLVRFYPDKRFVWLMGADNLAQFDQWRDWRSIARTVPIAVIARPGYDGDAMTSPAMAWLRRYRVPAASIRKRGRWSAPALVLLRFDPDTRSATAIRRTHAGWAETMLGVDRNRPPLRDRLTFRTIRSEAQA